MFANQSYLPPVKERELAVETGEWIINNCNEMDATQLSPENTGRGNLSVDLESSPGTSESSAASSSHQPFSDSFTSSGAPYYNGNSGVNYVKY